MKGSAPTKVPESNEVVSHRPIPIHSVRLLIVITDCVGASRAKRNAIYGPCSVDCIGLCTWDDGFRVALFLDRKHLCHELIAHETFHATHRILQYQGTEFSPNNHEPFALLHGWLSSHVYREIKRLGERVADEYPERTYLPGEPKLSGPHLRE